MRRLVAAIGTAAALLLAGAPPASAAEPAATGGQQDLVAVGGSVHLSAGQVVARDLVCIGCSSVVMDGTVTRDLVVIGGGATVNGAVGRDAVAIGGDLDVSASGSVARDATAVGGQVKLAPGATVGRHTGSADWFAGGPWLGGLPGLGFHPLWLNPFFPLASIAPAVGLVLLAVLLLLLFPRQLQATGRMIEERPAASFGLGCLGVVAATVLAALLGITLVLLPVSFVIAIVVAAAWAFGWAALFLVVGARVLVMARSPLELLPALLVGGAIYALSSVVPVLGFLVALAGGSVALGAALGSRFGTRTWGEPLFGHRPPAPPWPPATPPPAAPGSQPG